MCNCVQKNLGSQTWRCTICIRHYPIQTTSLPMKNHWQKQKKSWLFWWRTTFLVWNVPLANGGLMCMSTKETLRCLFRWFLWYQCLHVVELARYIDNLFTKVHETGQVCILLYRETQPLRLWGLFIFLAEIASTTNEKSWPNRPLEEAKTMLLVLLFWITLMASVGTVFSIKQFAEFEHAIHKVGQEGTVLTSEFEQPFMQSSMKNTMVSSKGDNPEIQRWMGLDSTIPYTMFSNIQQVLQQLQP